MKSISKTVAVSALLKPAMLVLLFGLISRIADMTGVQLSLVSPAADFVEQMTGLSYDNAVGLVIGLIAFCLLRVLIAAYGVLTVISS